MPALNTIPDYPSRPLVGVLPEVRRDSLGVLKSIVARCGDVASYRFGPFRQYLINTPELAQAILVDQADSFEKSREILLVRPLLGDGLVTTPNAKHRRQRKLVAPAFQHRRIANYAETMAKDAEQYAAGLRDGATVDLAEDMMQLTLRIVGQTLFGLDLKDEAPEIGATIGDLVRLFADVVRAYVPLPLGVPTPTNLALRRALKQMDQIVYRVIAERRKNPGDRGDLLSMLLAAHDEDDGTFMTDQQVRDEVVTLIIAGHETTAVGLTWAWYLLGRNPEVAGRLRTEVNALLAGRTPAFADLPNLPYPLQVFKEAMRIYPPVFLIARQATRPVDVGDYHFPKGSSFAISPYVMHRRPEVFPDPERFDPDRFSPEREKQIPRQAYLPFGGGPRICIGNQFALMEGQILLATIAQRVHFAPIPGLNPEPEPLLTLRPKGGMPMSVKRET